VNDFALRPRRLSYSELGSTVSLYKQSFQIPPWVKASFLPDNLSADSLKHSDTFGFYDGENLVAATTIYPKGQMALVAQTAVLPEQRENGAFDSIENFIQKEYGTNFNGNEVKPAIIVRESPEPDEVKKLIGVRVGTKNILTGKYGYRVVEEVGSRYSANNWEGEQRLNGFVLAKQIRDLPAIRSRKAARVKIKISASANQSQTQLFSIHAASRFSFAFGTEVIETALTDAEAPSDAPQVSIKYFGRGGDLNSGKIVVTAYSSDVSQDDARLDLLAGPEISLEEGRIIFDGTKIAEGFPKAPGELNLYVLYDNTKPAKTEELIDLVQQLEGRLARAGSLQSTVRYLSHARGGHTTHVVPVKPKWISKTEKRLMELNGNKDHASNRFDFVLQEGVVVFLGHRYEIRADDAFQSLSYMEKT